MAKRIRQWEPATIQLDEPLQIEVKRLSVEENAKYERLWARCRWRESDRLVTVRRPGDEQARTATAAISTEDFVTAHGTLALLKADPQTSVASALLAFEGTLSLLTPTDRFVVPDEEIRARRWFELTPEQRAEYERLQKLDELAFEEFLREVVGAFIRVVPGQIEIEEEPGKWVPMTTGTQLAQNYGMRDGLMAQIVAAIVRENRLSEKEKNDLRSRSASEPGSNERDQKVPGPSPETTAAAADASATATSAAATPPETTSSGATAALNSEAVPSSS